jgi:hypothetical protein
VDTIHNMKKFSLITIAAILQMLPKAYGQTTTVEATTTAATVTAAATTITTTASTATGGEVPADATANGFTPIDGDFSMVKFVTISPSCRTPYPNAIFTIKPSTVAYVSAYPANLVTPTVSGNVLKFEWNDAVAKGATSGGVRIGLPPDQFISLALGTGLTAQILSGFTSVEKLAVGGGSTLEATLTSSPNSNVALNLSVDGGSTVNVVSNNVDMGSVTLNGGSTVKVQTLLVNSIKSQGGSTLKVNGNVGSGNVGGGSTMLVTGDISGAVDNGSGSTINANKISGSINNSGGSTVNAVSCNNVASSCNTAGPPSVSVDVSQYGSISTSTRQCYGQYGAISTSTTFGYTSLGFSNKSFSIAAVAGVTTLVAFLVM